MIPYLHVYGTCIVLISEHTVFNASQRTFQHLSYNYCVVVCIICAFLVHATSKSVLKKKCTFVIPYVMLDCASRPRDTV